MLVIHLRSGNTEHIVLYWEVCQMWGYSNPEEEISLCENYRVMNLKSAKWDSGRATPGEGLSFVNVHTQYAPAQRWSQLRTSRFSGQLQKCFLLVWHPKHSTEGFSHVSTSETIQYCLIWSLSLLGSWLLETYHIQWFSVMWVADQGKMNGDHNHIKSQDYGQS